MHVSTTKLMNIHNLINWFAIHTWWPVCNFSIPYSVVLKRRPTIEVYLQLNASNLGTSFFKDHFPQDALSLGDRYFNFDSSEAISRKPTEPFELLMRLRKTVTLWSKQHCIYREWIAPKTCLHRGEVLFTKLDSLIVELSLFF